MDNNKQLLNDYLQTLDEVATDTKNKSIKLILPKGQKNYEYYIVSDLYLGSKHNIPKLKKLISQLKLVGARPNCFIVLGGNIFTSEKDALDISSQLKIAESIFAPYKKNIVLAYNGPEELKYRNKSEHNEPMNELCQKLKIENKFRQTGARINVIINNDWTGNKPVYCNDCFVAIKSNACMFSSTATAGIKAIGAPANFDNGFITCANNSFRAREAIMRATKDDDKIAKHNYNIIGTSGWKSFQRMPGGKLANLNYTDNYIYHICIGENKDSTRIVGKNTIIEEPLKVYLDTLAVEQDFYNQQEKDITTEFIEAKKNNDQISEICIEIIKSLQLQADQHNQKILTKIKQEIKSKNQGVNKCQ